MRSIILWLGLLVLLMAISPSEQMRRGPQRSPLKNQEEKAQRKRTTEKPQSNLDLQREEVAWELFKASNPRIRLYYQKLRQENAAPVTPPPQVVVDECGGCDKGQYCHQYFPECGVNEKCAEMTYVCSPVTRATEAPADNY